MDALIWGPVTWNFLHFLSISYPDKPSKIDVEKNKTFLKTLGDILPCIKCRDHYKNNISKYNIENELQSKDTYMKLIWKLHNDTNVFLKKKTMTFKLFLKEYQKIIDYGHFNPIDLYNENRILRIILISVSCLLFMCILHYFIMPKKE
tara:strand:- start:2654 stop:3097 length:444 start_codon:yes stop_codon:yes gene_type:complete